MLSLALAGTKVKTEPEAVSVLPRARLVPWVGPPGRVTVLLLDDWLPAASRARTWYETEVPSGWVSVYAVTLPATVVRSSLLAYTS